MDDYGSSLTSMAGAATNLSTSTPPDSSISDIDDVVTSDMATPSLTNAPTTPTDDKSRMDDSYSSFTAVQQTIARKPVATTSIAQEPMVLDRALATFTPSLLFIPKRRSDSELRRPLGVPIDADEIWVDFPVNDAPLSPAPLFSRDELLLTLAPTGISSDNAFANHESEFDRMFDLFQQKTFGRHRKDKLLAEADGGAA
jgi:hypothetical protein